MNCFRGWPFAKSKIGKRRLKKKMTTPFRRAEPPNFVIVDYLNYLLLWKPHCIQAL